MRIRWALSHPTILRIRLSFRALSPAITLLSCLTFPPPDAALTAASESLGLLFFPYIVGLYRLAVSGSSVR